MSRCKVLGRIARSGKGVLTSEERCQLLQVGTQLHCGTGKARLQAGNGRERQEQAALQRWAGSECAGSFALHAPACRKSSLHHAAMYALTSGLNARRTRKSSAVRLGGAASRKFAMATEFAGLLMRLSKAGL